ncbi:MAG: metallophosphoesterase [Actinomycetota bacterium]|nr:metallophosphoesterase [Actinomycetota bacterium]
MLPLVLIAILALGVSCVLYGALIERRWYRLVRHRLDILPADGPRSLTVLHLSDLHFLRRDAKKSRFLAELPRADVTVVTGDFLAEPEAVETAVAGVAAARGRLASWFVLGSNDYFAPRPLNYFAYFRRTRKLRKARRGRAPELAAQLRSDGWQDLTNVRLELSLDGLPIELLGLDDAHIRAHDLRVAPRRAPDRFGLAVMHSPDSAPEAAALGYRFILAGHTHGGQVCLPGIGALVTNCSLPPRAAKGLARIGGAILHTSPGLGTGKFAPFRFACRPEATLLELRPSAND